MTRWLIVRSHAVSHIFSYVGMYVVVASWWMLI